MTMPERDWKSFLEQWSKAVLSSDDLPYYNLPQSAIDSEWMGYPGASEDEIAAVEKRLGKTLPPSYRSFLKASNGWMQTGYFIHDLWPVVRINWLRILNPEQITIWDNDPGLNDLPWQDHGSYRMSEVEAFNQLASTLQISDWGDEEILLLNPEVVSTDGEWEAWFMAGWIPGAYRFPSFWDLTQYLYDGLLQFKVHQNQRATSISDLNSKLPNLYAELQSKADSFARMPAESGGMGYGKGVADGLSEAQSLIHAAEQASVNLTDLRSRLLQIAADLNQRARQMPGPNSIFGMVLNMNKMLDAIYDGGKREGYRQAAGIIRWFLGD